MQTISVIVGLFIGVGTIIMAIGYFYSQVKLGGDKYKDNLISTLKETVAALEERNKRLSEEKNQLIVSHQAQLTQLTKELGELKGAFLTEQKRASEYKDLLLQKDPQQMQILKEIKSLMKTLNKKTKVSKIAVRG